jgi:hypothetical protein
VSRGQQPGPHSDEELRGFIESAGGPASLGRAIGYPILALKGALVAEAEASNKLSGQMWWLTLVGVIVAIVGAAATIVPLFRSGCP